MDDRPTGLSASRRLLSPLVAVALVLAACGSTARPTPNPTASPSPTPAPTATPSPTPSPTPTAAPTASPSPTPPPDAAADLLIAEPWQLEPLSPAIEALLREQFVQSTGAFSSLVALGSRQVTRSGALRAYVFVLDMPPEMVKVPSFWTGLVAGIESSTGVKSKSEKVGGIEVRTIQSGTSSVAIALHGSSLYLVTALSVADLIPITKALLVANP
jgi:hypothetical protein